MCGICGTVGGGDAEVMERMVKTLDHRGPDDAGFELFDDGGRVGLGHTRLAVIDLSPQGHQPMCNEDGSVWITFNGEIYNYPELKRELEAKGHVFRSATDTEVILHLYEEKGEACVEDLNGMFAFAVWDRTRRRLFAARDRLGIKPLYYAVHAGRLYFASEIKAILAARALPVAMDPQAFWDYLTYLYVPHPRTIFRGISHLPPGSTLTFAPGDADCRVHTFWTPGAPDGPAAPFPDLVEELRSTVSDAVRRRLVSDVPLGTFLSGGIDSAVLTGLTAQHSAKPVQTFTVVFEGEGVGFFDEREAARTVSQRYGTDHHELLIDISDPGDVMDLVRFFDQPFGNPTFYLSYLINRYTRQHVTVALSGAGGDELFGGYPRYRVLGAARWTRFMPALMARGLRRGLDLFPDDFGSPSWRRAKLFFEGVDPDFVRQYQKWTYYLDEPAKGRLVRQEALGCGVQGAAEALRAHFDAAAAHDVYGRVQFADLKGYLADNILDYADKTSMAVALEVRVPFLDHRVVELSFAIPFGYKLHKGTSKYILKQAFKDLIPQEHLRMPKKGFCAPLPAWIDRHLDRYFDSHMNERYVADQGLFHWPFIQALRDQHRRRKRDNSMELFGLIMFDAWFRHYIRGDAI